ncbi:MAG TPA: glutamyl-tRNA reductase [Balneolaceae bacterium]|nr:glutamyl-tRNA reductase [Balneolaceae bacterium]
MATCPALHTFCIVGVNHWKASIDVRERFSLSVDQKKMLIEGAEQQGISSLFVISTCNRTEIVAQNASPDELSRLLITYSQASLDEFQEYGFAKNGHEAVEHLFKVAIGLESQVLGDVQIVKQVKDGYKLAADMDAVDGDLHRLMQHVFRAHKRSRNETSLGEGAATTAYAAVKFALNTFNTISDKDILLVGAGEIGKVACKNLMNLGPRSVTLVNRTPGRADFLADRFDFESAAMETLPHQIAEADLIIVATGAQNPVVTMEDMREAQKNPSFKIMLDLSVPRNIAPEIGDLEFVDLANMDFFSDVTNKAHREREQDIPRAKEIIINELTDYQEWLRKQTVVPTIKALTQKFENIREDEFEFFKNKIKETDRDKVENLTRRIVNKIAAYSIEHLRDHHESDHIRKVVNEMFKLEPHAVDE